MRMLGCCLFAAKKGKTEQRLASAAGPPHTSGVRVTAGRTVDAVDGHRA